MTVSKNLVKDITNIYLIYHYSKKITSPMLRNVTQNLHKFCIINIS